MSPAALRFARCAHADLLVTGAAGRGSLASRPAGRASEARWRFATDARCRAERWLGCARCWAVVVRLRAPRRDAQITSLADDIIILSAGVGNQAQQQADAHLARPAGSGGNPFGYSPGSGDRRLGPQGVPGPGGGGRSVQSSVIDAAAGEPQYRPVGNAALHASSGFRPRSRKPPPARWRFPTTKWKTRARPTA